MTKPFLSKAGHVAMAKRAHRQHLMGQQQDGALVSPKAYRDWHLALARRVGAPTDQEN
jgi:hypothetical protein